MAAFQIAPPAGVVPKPLDFANWFGDGPPVITETGLTFTKPGADSVAIQKTGRTHRALEVTLESHFPNFNAAVTELSVYRKVPLSGQCDIRYANVNWSKFKMAFHVLEMNLVAPQQVVHLLHATYSYPLGAKLLTRWVLQPVEV